MVILYRFFTIQKNEYIEIMIYLYGYICMYYLYCRCVLFYGRSHGSLLPILLFINYIYNNYLTHLFRTIIREGAFYQKVNLTTRRMVSIFNLITTYINSIKRTRNVMGIEHLIWGVFFFFNCTYKITENKPNHFGFF